MPTADQLPMGGFQASYTFVNLDPTRSDGADRLELWGTYYGLADRLEVSFFSLRPNVGTDLSAWNVSYLVQPESTENWATCVGVYNLSGSDYLRGDDASFFLAAAKTFNPSLQPPTPNNPVYRGLVGFGTKSHRRWFGGVQVGLSARLSVTAASYAQDPIYMATLRISNKPEAPVARLGSWDGSQFYGLSWSRLY